nr:helix-turn-helix domain-containing protein [uncultured Oscillibacter sp.]
MCKYDEYGYPIDDENEGEFQPNEFLTPREVMELLAIGRNTFYRLVNSRELSAFRIGKLWRVHSEDLRRYAERQIADT